MRTILGAALALIAIGSFAAWATGGPLIFALGTVLLLIALMAVIGGRASSRPAFLATVAIVGMKWR